MLNKEGNRELAYVVKIDNIEEIVGSDNCEAAVVGGWKIMTRKNTFKPGDLAIYFEIDSHVDTNQPEFAFLAPKHGNIKTQKYTFGGKNPGFYSQGLLMSAEDFGGVCYQDGSGLFYLHFGKDSFFKENIDYGEGDFLTEKLGVTYAIDSDNKRKAKSNPDARINAALSRHPAIAKRYGKIIKKNKFLRWLFMFLFGRKKKDSAKEWPVGKFPGVTKTDQERVENMPWILQDKTPFIVTQKCDGSSGTYILEKKGKNKYEFYVCSRNVRMASQDQECFYGSHNYYWEVAIKYDIENKMKKWLEENPSATWVCWQGEICAEGIQGNPHGLTETHFYCFHWTDNINGRISILEARNRWKRFGMEVVPIVDTNYIMPDDFEEFKASADGYYDMSVCEGKKNKKREGFVYYKTTEPTFSFKNVSREYLLKHS